ncbi:MAG: ABC transporter ATP-binding protein [Candidatus Eisenbacteria bacterium]|uniref:ABC transporter ATP-binding protein n=1 Tax=Eiseniibacteriota bacterium TaxID=2212470 RepID=A0A9D6QPJ6_UNCEI|nr:ABC transporter ATP-binding protein [Candidatus Eisenbacteria bacterium]MBI3540009.1 ABC transporter ATP-binding protein [Candidatus Eisenbacteria bacterium]
MSVLKVAGARKSFDKTQALGGVSLELGAGELLGLLGPNGAGKTTLVRAIAGRVRLDGGTIELFGREITAATNGARAGLGVVPQEIALYPLLTARENLSVWGRLHGVTPGDLAPRITRALDWTALGDRADEPIKRFSGGMKRRLNIACGILHEPRVLLLDEPTVGVDPQSRERIYDMLAELRERGVSLLLTTHQLEEAEAHCQRIVVIDHGKVAAAGTLAELVEATVGAERRVTLTLDRAPDRPLPGFEAGESGVVVRAHVRDVAAEMPGLLGVVRDAGCKVTDVEVRSPSLQSVFIHLTGRELRE